MGKRGAGSAADGKPAAKARTIGAAFDRAKQRPLGFPDFDAWRPRVIAESRAYYGNRSEQWMKTMWEKVKDYSEHSLSQRFFEESLPIPFDKTAWIHNPKETCDKFEAWLKANGLAAAPVGEEVSAAESSPVVPVPPLPEASPAPTGKQTLREAVVAPEWKTLESAAIAACKADELFELYVNQVRLNEGLTQKDWQFADPAGDLLCDLNGFKAFLIARRQPVPPELDAALTWWQTHVEGGVEKLEGSDVKMQPTDATDEGATLAPLEALQATTAAAVDTPEWKALESAALAACKAHDLLETHCAVVVQKEGFTQKDWQFADPAGDLLCDLQDFKAFLTARRQPVPPELDAALTWWQTHVEGGVEKLEGSDVKMQPPLEALQATTAAAVDTPEWKALESAALAACKAHDLLETHCAEVVQKEGFTQKDWQFADPAGDLLCDLQDFKTFLIARRQPVPPELDAALTWWGTHVDGAIEKLEDSENLEVTMQPADAIAEGAIAEVSEAEMQSNPTPATDNAEWQALESAAIAACESHDLFETHCAQILEKEGLDPEEWNFADPTGDPHSDLKDFKAFLVSGGHPAPPELDAALAWWGTHMEGDTFGVQEVKEFETEIENKTSETQQDRI